MLAICKVTSPGHLCVAFAFYLLYTVYYVLSFLEPLSNFELYLFPPAAGYMYKSVYLPFDKAAVTQRKQFCSDVVTRDHRKSVGKKTLAVQNVGVLR